jgi:hypothetical protein
MSPDEPVDGGHDFLRKVSDMAHTSQNQGISWRRAGRCNRGAECVELSVTIDGDIMVRDSKDPNGPVLSFTLGEMRAFVEGVLAGEFADLVPLP